MQLTPEQQAIIDHQQGHAKVVAVAGAGKTTTLALFIRERLLQGQNPKRLLVIMYNKSAQLDFTSKLQRLVTNSPLPQVRTFHALALRIYQKLVSDGVLPSFNESLIKQFEQERILWRLMQQHANKQTALEILQDKKKWLDPMMSFMEKVKSCLEPAELVFKESGLPKNCHFFVQVFQAYEEWRGQVKRIGYEDMLYDPCLLFPRRTDIAARFANHMDWILVDEYQDINPIQQFLLETLAGTRSNVLVIGDPDQTIYEFRGSSSEFMLHHFDVHFKQVALYTLSTTFRYGHDVALLSNQLIQFNKEREPVLAIASDSNIDTQVTLHQHPDDALKVLSIIREALNEFPAEKIAILFRLWGMSATVELVLLQENIPYQMAHHSWVLQRYELQPLMMLFEMAHGQFFKRTVNSRMQAWFNFLTFPAMKIKRSELESIAQQLARIDFSHKTPFLDLSTDDLSKWQVQQLDNRLLLVTLALDSRIKAAQLCNRYIRETDFYKGLADSAFSKQMVDDRIATVQGFIRFVSRLNLSPADTHLYLQELTEKRAKQSNKSGIVLSSIHRAKGLEWPVVILPGLNKHYYPYQNESEMQKSGSIEGERRLFYVAMTRSINQLHLITPLQGQEHSEQMELSPFVNDMVIDDLLKVKPAYENKEVSLLLPKKIVKSVSLYVEKLNWLMDIEAIKIIKPLTLNERLDKRDKVANSKKIDMYSQPLPVFIEHSTLGKGRITQETDRHLHITFEDGKSRTLDKDIAGPFLNWL